MAASGTYLQVLTASNLIDAVHSKPVLWNSHLEAAEEEKELACVTCIVQLSSKHVAAKIMASHPHPFLIVKNIYNFVNS